MRKINEPGRRRGGVQKKRNEQKEKLLIDNDLESTIPTNFLN